jgi:lysozyme
MSDSKRVLVPRFLDLIKKWELYMEKAYRDKDGSWHVGYGHGNAAGVPPFVTEETTLTPEEAIQVLEADLQYLIPIVEKMVLVPVTDNEFCALLDVAYNRGPGTLRKSAVIYHLNNASDPLNKKKAAQAFVFQEEGFAPLNMAQDIITKEQRVYLGLTLRRIDDASLFLTPIQEN